MEDIKDVSTSAMTNSRFIRPLRLNYTQDGKKKLWDLALCHKAVYIVIFNETRKKLVFQQSVRIWDV